MKKQLIALCSTLALTLIVGNANATVKYGKYGSTTWYAGTSTGQLGDRLFMKSTASDSISPTYTGYAAIDVTNVSKGTGADFVGEMDSKGAQRETGYFYGYAANANKSPSGGRYGAQVALCRAMYDSCFDNTDVGTACPANSAGCERVCNGAAQTEGTNARCNTAVGGDCVSKCNVGCGFASPSTPPCADE
jgi:hypothetical protein